MANVSGPMADGSNKQMPSEPTHFSDCEALTDTLTERIGKRIVVGLPLGLGEANHVINALYRRARRDPTLSLSIFTALTLGTPRAGNELQRRCRLRQPRRQTLK